VKRYQDDISTALDSHSAVRQAVENPRTRRLQEAHKRFPLMSYLFTDPENGQKRIGRVGDEQVKALIGFIMEKFKVTTCPIRPKD
jgi:hypothetical protein